MKSKRVLVIIPHLSIGGTEIQTLNLVQSLCQGGYSVDVLCLYRNIPSMVKAYEDVGAHCVIASPLYNNSEVKIQYQYGLTLIKFLYVTIKKTLKRQKYDVIHVQYMTPCALMILMLYFLFGQRNIIATSHTYGDIYDSLNLLHFIEKHCLRVFTCITQLAEKSFFGNSTLYTDNFALKKHNHFTIYNALPSHISIADSLEYRLKSEENNFQQLSMAKPVDNFKQLTIGVVSRLEEIKGMDLVIPAFVKVHAVHANTELLVVGDGSLYKLMKKQVVEYGLTNAVTFVGRQGQETLQGYYDQIDILLMPSRSEGFGLTAIEAMARGCVVVAANVGGLPEVVKDGEVGLLHMAGNVDDMALQVNNLVDNSELRQDLSSSSLKYVKQYSYEEYQKQFCSLYEKL